MRPMPWFRTYSEMLSDKKIKRIFGKTGIPRYSIAGLWVLILAMANESPVRGHLLISEGIPYELSDIENETDCDLQTLKVLMSEFSRLDMLGKDGDTYFVKHWDERNPPSDNVYTRVQRFRDKQAAAEQKKADKPAREKREYTRDEDGIPSWMPNKLRDICIAFSACSKIEAPLELDKDWLKGLNDLAAMEATPELIDAAVRRLKKSNMIVSRPGALLKTVRALGASEPIERIDANGNVIKEY